VKQLLLNNKVLLKRLSAVLSLGYVFLYFSELLFWAKYKSDYTIAGLILTWVIYSFAAYIVIIIIERGKLKTYYGLFLAGSMFGWLVEGLVVYTMYDAFPFQIVWTGLAWHALISVLLGIYLFDILSHRYVKKTVFTSLAIGIVYGFWSVWWTIEDGLATPAVSYFLFILGSTILLIVAYITLNYTYHKNFKPSRIEYGFISVFVLFYFILAIITLQFTILLWICMMAIPFTAIYINLKKNPEENNKNNVLYFQEKMSWNVLYILLIPFSASVTYELLRNYSIESNIYIALVSVLTSIIFMIVSVIKSTKNVKI